MTYKTYCSKSKDESLEKLSEIIANNFSTTEKIIRHCHKLGIKGYRLSSDLCPVLNHPEVNLKLEDLPNFKYIEYLINNVARAIFDTNLRIAAHPSEYITLTSDDPNAIKNSITDLESHADIFNRLNLQKSHFNPLNIHCRKDGDPQEISSKFMRNFDLLSDSVKSRLVIENNDNASGVWSIQNLIKYFNEPYKIPITFDNLHHKMLPGDLTEEEAFINSYFTWDCEPIFHYSEGKNNTKAHADMAENLPPNYGGSVLWEVELKNKDYAILNILERHKNVDGEKFKV